MAVFWRTRMARTPSKGPDHPFHDPVIQAYMAHVDRSLLRKNCSLSVEERFLQLMELQRFADELKRAGAEAGRPKDFAALAELEAIRDARDDGVEG